MKEPVKPNVKPPAKAKAARPNIEMRPKNWALLGAGLVTIIVGYILLSSGSITLAPLLLVAGYCVIIPVGILIK
jgi:hypothetical protein